MSSEWRAVETDEEIEQLLSAFGAFHDGCLREAHVWAETWVNDNLSMAVPSHRDTHVRLLFQRQWRDPSAIELLFDEVSAFHLAPSGENQDSIIFDAAVFQHDGLIYWAEWCEWKPEVSWRDEVTWVAGRRLRWREVSEWMGPELRYGTAPEF